jgi:hypothetical protein
MLIFINVRNFVASFPKKILYAGMNPVKVRDLSRLLWIASGV